MRRLRHRAGLALALALYCGMPAAAAGTGELSAIADLGPATGDHPYAAIAVDTVIGRPSTLYTTTTGGAGRCYENYGCGSVIALTPPTTAGGKWGLHILHRFRGRDGEVPFAGVVLDSYGALYGDTTRGGRADCGEEAGCGTVFKLAPPRRPGGAWTETTLYAFRGGPDGTTPTGDVAFDTFGALYGTTIGGGALGHGTLFRLTPPARPGGEWTKTILHDFTGIDGARPRGRLIFDSRGALYGVTEAGGAANLGAVYRLAPPSAPGGAWTETVLHDFAGGADGTQPFYGLIFGPAGSLYGTTWKGGIGNHGTAFKLTPQDRSGARWIESVYRFNGSDGDLLQGGLAIDSFGGLYGTTNRGGTGNCRRTDCGTVFELIPPAGARGIWRHRVLANFDGKNGGDPEVAPTFLLGNLYGTADYGGSANLGTVFRLAPAAR